MNAHQAVTIVMIEDDEGHAQGSAAAEVHQDEGGDAQDHLDGE